MRLYTFLLLFGASALLPAQSGFNGIFTATIDGLACQISLATTRTELSGTYDEGNIHLKLKGTVNGKQAGGDLYDPASGQTVATFQASLRDANTLDLTVEAQGQKISHPFQRSTASATSATQAAGQAHDAKLVGNWNHQIITNSGGSGFTTVLYFQIGADGRYAQYSKSVGGGSEWSYNSGKAELQQQGRWYTRDNIIYIQPEGQPEFIAAATYRFYESRLVTEDVNGRKIWTRE
jgi:hypothetical protein